MPLVFGADMDIIVGETPILYVAGIFLRHLTTIYSFVASIVPQRKLLVTRLASPLGVNALRDFALNKIGDAKMNTPSFPNTQIGHIFPAEYLDSIGYQLYHTLRDWMKEQKLPQEFIDALDVSTVLIQYAHYKEKNMLCDASADDIPISLANAVNYIKLFGGEYSDSMTTIQFENMVEVEC